MRFNKITFILGSLVLLIGGVILLQPLLAQAQVSLGLPSSIGGLSNQDPRAIIGNIVRIIFGFLGILLVLLILYGGWLWMTSQGNEDQIDRAKKVITSAVIGLALTLAAFSIAAFIVSNLQNATGPGGPGGPPGPGGGPCPDCLADCPNPGPVGPPKVCALSRSTAGLGDTVTAIGYNFGLVPGQVIFEGGTPVVAQLVQCSGTAQWTDNKVVFKVPSSIDPGINYLVKVKKVGASCTDLGGLCQSLFVDSSSNPNLNCINPTSGTAGIVTPVTLEGSNFGNTPDDVEMTGANGRFTIGAANIISWQADTIKINVPIASPEPAISGEIKVKVGSELSNGAYFAVSCTADTECASTCCRSNSCQLLSVCTSTPVPVGVPVITSISPDNGEVGNFVTITGNNFGLTPATVHIQVGATDYTVTTPPAVACNATWWGDRQIIIAIPVAIGVATNGPAAVTVENATGESGSVNFDLNDIVRPGVCSLNPVQGQFKDVVTLIGTNFTALLKVQFGGIDGDSVNFSSPTQATAKVPNILPATVGVTVKVGSEASNPLAFLVSTTASGQARIDYLDPTSGPAGQYVQIYGSNFGNSAGVVRFIKGEDMFIGDTGFPAACSSQFWRHDHIVVKVPSDIAATIGDYQVQVHPSAGVDSNLVDFTKNTNPLAPGICLLDPAKGPINTPVTISGDHFGASPQVQFSNNVSSAISASANQQIITTVPLGAITGLVTVQSGADTSAGVPFEVGSCSNNTECPGGSQCCSDGACRVSCTATSGPQCKYRWSFTTGQNPFELHIISECSSEGQSPSPYAFYQLGGYDAIDASKNAPIDSAIAARFTADLDFSSIGSGPTASIVVYRCITDADGDPIEATCVNPVAGSFSQWAGSRGFMFESTDVLAAETWYKVALNANSRFVLARDGSRLQLFSPLDEGWLFRTRSATQAMCQPTVLSVAPGGQIMYLGNSAQFSAAALDGSSCTFCRSSSLTWNWSTNPAAPNALVSLITNNNQVSTLADQDKTGLGTIIANLVDSSLAPGQASFEVKSGDPFVTTFSPGASCVSACTNAEVRASFNMPMQPSSVEDFGAVEVLPCSDANCTSFGAVIGATVTYQQDASGQRVIVTPTTNLSASTWYRVVIKNSLKNTYGAALSHLNYPISSPDSFSWKFKTGNSACTPDAVSLTPATYTAQVGQNINYSSSVLVNTIANCAVINLNAASYDWAWTSADTIVASITATNTNQETVSALSLSLPTGVAITAKLTAFPAITPAIGILNINTGGGVPIIGPPLNLVGSTPLNDTLVCRNAEVSALFTNSLANFSAIPFSISCSSGTCPFGQPFIQGKKLVYKFNNSQDLWPANTTVTVQLQTQVMDTFGQTWISTGNPNATWKFKTTDSLCKIGYVEVDPHPFTFTTPISTTNFVASARATDGTPITGVNYLWTLNTGPIITVPAWTTPNVHITSQNKNGTDYAYVVASGILAGEDLGQVTGHARVNVKFCENPWLLSPYVDSEYDFSFDYCKDSIAPGSNDLPNLPQPVVRIPNSSGSGDVLKEHVFVVDPTRAGGTVTGGANQNPTFGTDPTTVTATVGELIYFQLTASDPEGDQYVMLADSSLPNGASFNPFTGVFIWVPESAGSFSPKFHLRNDGATNVDTKIVTITVKAASASLVIPKVTMALPSNGSTIYANVGEQKNFTAGVLAPIVPVESFVWDFQDSGVTSDYTNFGTSFNVKHTFAQVGVKQVTFRAKAVNGGWSQPAVVTVIVRRPVSWLPAIFAPVQQLVADALAQGPIRWFSQVKAQVTGQAYDVIVVRVMKNIEHLSPMEWYRKYAPNPTGNPTTLMVNGYPAIQDGTTTYVAAANIPSGPGGGGTVFTNIYLISYNASAKDTTKRIVKQLLDTWSFNNSFIDGDTFGGGGTAKCHLAATKLCNTDAECGKGDYCLSQKAIIRRDVARYTNLHSIGRSLQEYATAHRFCQNNPLAPCLTNGQCGSGGLCLSYYPKLTAGSYVAGMSISKWPSWQESFATVLGGTQPVDPVNYFDSCAGGAFAPYDRETCWDAKARQFSCPADAMIYIYQVQQDTNYKLSANLETNLIFTWPKENQNLLFTNASICTETPQAGICGNSVREGAEICDGGFTNACPAGSNNQRTVGCLPDCSDWLPILPLSCGGVCGDGAWDALFEQCDQTVPAGWSCSFGGTINCGNQCRFSCSVGQPYAGKCGDGSVQLPEVCDDGLANGNYNKCNTSCSGYGDFCGDTVVNAPEEQCDTSQGLAGHSCPTGQSLYCSSDCQRSCSNLTPASVKPGICGNNVVESSNGEQCEPDLYLSPKPEDSTVAEQYVCGDTSSGAQACQIVGGYCSDGIVQNPFENCDKGLAGNVADCDNRTKACSYCSKGCKNTTLQKNFCGDKKINVGPDNILGTSDDVEVCDEGSALNGLPGRCNVTCSVAGDLVPAPDCGDGVPELPEICDDGEALNGTVGYCNATCSGIVSPNNCNNSIPDGPDGIVGTADDEFCDDGPVNGQPLQCNLSCSGWTTASCGNYIREPAPFGDEQCDLGEVNGQVGSTCSGMCQIVDEIIIIFDPEFCGDGDIQFPNDDGIFEVCDNGTANGTAGNCWNDCLRPTKYCGDNLQQTPNDTTPSQAGFNEFCDNGPANGRAVGKCNVSCTALITEICLDRLVTGTERCDLCPTGSNYCNASGVQITNCNPATCQLTVAAGQCGNGTTEPANGENCDNGGGAAASTNFISKAGLGLCYGCRWQCGDNISNAPVPQPKGKCTWSFALCSFDSECGIGSVCQPYDWTKNEPGGELCDLGITGNGQVIGQCNSMCYDPATRICGNNTIESGEQCDDGAQTGQGGHCGPVCDPSYPGLCVKDDNAYPNEVCNCDNVICGDIVVSQTCNPATSLAGDGEKCDLGANNGVPGSNCNQWCSGKCGNGGPLDPGETCDDGALNGQPGQCNNTCSGFTLAICNNGTLEPKGPDNVLGTADDEICDFGSGSGDWGCDASNAVNGTGQRCCNSCSNICGNGGGPGPYETCDEGVALNGQPGHCNLYCTGIAPALSCGDGIISPLIGEQCDGLLLNGANCTNLGYYGPGTVSCYPNSAPAIQRCTYNITACQRCGDNLINGTPAEACDGTNLNSQNCTTLGQGIGTPTCNADCTFNISACSGPSTCGDGNKTAAEACDYGPASVTKDFGYETCIIAGLPGILTTVCTANCTNKASGTCVPFGVSALARAGADVTYINNSSKFYPACTTPVPDQQGVQYSNNACSVAPSVNIPAQTNTSLITGAQMYRSNVEQAGAPNIVAIKFNTTKAATCGGALAAVASQSNNLIYYLSNWQFNRTTPSRWLCVTNWTGAANDDALGRKWYDFNFTESATWVPPQWSIFSGGCNLAIQTCADVASGNTVACNGATGLDGTLQNSWLWQTNAPSPGSDTTIYCRLKYWAD